MKKINLVFSQAHSLNISVFVEDARAYAVPYANDTTSSGNIVNCMAAFGVALCLGW